MKNKCETSGKETAIFIEYKGQEITTLIDTEDLEKASQIKNTWKARYDANVKNYYVFCWQDHRCISLHRLIMDTPCELVVDHINHDTLNNKKHNLRNVTQYENCQNMIKDNIHLCKQTDEFKQLEAIRQLIRRQKKYVRSLLSNS
jgi:hypothetical protein